MAGLDPPIERLGKYQVTEVLGKGAMGVVYKAFDPHIRRVVAIKTIRKELVEDDSTGQMIARFKNEAQAAGRLSHPGIVSVYEYGEDNALSYIAMEYVQGNSLREYFNRNTRFEESDIVSIMVQLLDALEYSHEQGVVHRDIKPANIIIMTNGKLKIADFGIARIDESNLTQIGAVMGTPGYMAPEQYSGETVDWRADLFSAGVVLYQLLTGRKPFSGTADSVAYQVCHIDPPVPSQVEAGRGWDRYDQVMATALAKQPDARYQVAKAFRAAILEAYAAPVSPAVSEETVITEVAPTTIRLEPTHPSESSEAKAPVKTVPPPGWDSAVLKQVETQLARFVGPVAKVMVKRAATGTNDIATLYARLADNLSSREEKKAFLTGGAELQVTLPPPSESPSAAPKGGLDQRQLAAAPVTPETIAQATRLLAAYLGPIARIVIKKAAAQATDRRQFYQILADSVSNEGDRIRFLQDVRAVS